MKILACVDQSRFASHVTDYAAWAARRLNAPLELLHVINRHPETATHIDHSGAIGFDAQENLLTELTDKDSARSKSAREQGYAWGHVQATKQIEKMIKGKVSDKVMEQIGQLPHTYAKAGW